MKATRFSALLLLSLGAGCAVMQGPTTKLSAPTKRMSFTLREPFSFTAKAGLVMRVNRTYTFPGGEYACLGEDDAGGYFVHASQQYEFRETLMPGAQRSFGGIFVPFDPSRPCQPFFFSESHEGRGSASGTAQLVEADLPEEFRTLIGSGTM